MFRECTLLVYSGAPWGATGGGQRPQRLAMELAGRFANVIHVGDSQWGNTKEQENIFIPAWDGFEQEIDKIIGGGGRVISLICFPYDYDRIIARSKWYIYDIIDDWEEFHKVDIAGWYDKEQEDRLINCAMGITYTASGYFIDKFNIRIAGGCHVPNGGLNENDVIVNPKEFDGGKKNIVCVSYVGGPWWDWDAVGEIDATCAENGWKFHIVGGGDTSLKPDLRATIFYGPLPRQEALGIVKRCNVGVIPFKGDICPSVDPVKYHEYLTMGIQTVAGMDLEEMHNFKKFPCANFPVEGWKKALEKAMGKKVVVTDEMKYEHSWKGRADQMYKYMLKTAFGGKNG